MDKPIVDMEYTWIMLKAHVKGPWHSVPTNKAMQLFIDSHRLPIAKAIETRARACFTELAPFDDEPEAARQSIQCSKGLVGAAVLERMREVGSPLIDFFPLYGWVASIHFNLLTEPKPDGSLG